MSVSDDSSLDVGTGSFSFAAWMRRDANSATNLRLLSKGAGHDTDKGYCIWASETKVTAALSNGSSRITAAANHNGVDEWTHVAVSINRGSSTMELYIDGQLAKTSSISSFSGSNISNGHDLNIGRNVSSSAQYWDGRLDDVRVYRRALYPIEIEIMAKQTID